MPQVTATLNQGSRVSRSLTKAKNEEMNGHFMLRVGPGMRHVPQTYIRIWNISDFPQRIERPWANYVPGAGKCLTIQACEADKQYSVPYLIPDIVQVPEDVASQGRLRAEDYDGKFLAQDALNPNDPNGDWRTIRLVSEASLQSIDTNLYFWGLFWDEAPANDRLCEPDSEALAMAVKRLEANYNKLINDAQALYMTGDEGRKQIGNTHRRAANYFGRSFPWNEVFQRQIQCPGCGTALPSVAVICPKCPAVFNWEKALQFGLRTMEQAKASGYVFGDELQQAKKAARKTKSAA